MAESSAVNTRGPWFCPYCGTLCSLFACDWCLAPKPFEMPLHNPATSIFSVLHGPIGYWGLPQYMAIFLLAFQILLITSIQISRAEIADFELKYQSKH